MAYAARKSDEEKKAEEEKKVSKLNKPENSWERSHCDKTRQCFF